jgi:peptide deformylase
VIQHELDHLDGIVFTDRVSTLAKLKLKRKLNEMQATAVNGTNIRKDADD